MKKYLIDDSNLEIEDSGKVYQVAFNWACKNGDSFNIKIDRNIYDDQTDLQNLTSLGIVKEFSYNEPQNAFERWIGRYQKEKLLSIKGKINTTFVDTILNTKVPPRNISGELCPVLDLAIYENDNKLYQCIDYGRTQIVFLTDIEFQNLTKELATAGINEKVLEPVNNMGQI